MLRNVQSEAMGPCGFIRPIPACWDHLTRCCAALRLPRCSAALRLPPSLPLMSPYGLPSAGYPTSPRWHVFAPAELIRRISRPAPPSELPCGSLSRPSPKVSIRPSGQPSVVFDLHRPRCCALRANLRLVYLDQLIRRFSQPASPSELPCGSLSRPFPKVSILPSLRFSTFPEGLDSC